MLKEVRYHGGRILQANSTQSFNVIFRVVSSIFVCCSIPENLLNVFQALH